MFIYIYIYTPNLPTSIVDFRGLDSSTILISRGGILTSIGDLPEKFESSNLSRDNVSREIGRTTGPREAISRLYCMLVDYAIVSYSL